MKTGHRRSFVVVENCGSCNINHGSFVWLIHYTQRVPGEHEEAPGAESERPSGRQQGVVGEHKEESGRYERSD